MTANVAKPTMLQVPIEEALRQRLESLAAGEGRSAVDLAATILQEALEYEPRPVAIPVSDRDHERIVQALANPQPPSEEIVEIGRRYQAHLELEP